MCSVRPATAFPPSPHIYGNKMQEYGWHFYFGGEPIPPDRHRQMERNFNLPIRSVLRSTAMWDHQQLQSMLTQEQVDRLSFQLRDLTAEAAVEGTAVHLLNITALSAMRPNAHLIKWYNKANKASIQVDCVHLCLPGLRRLKTRPDARLMRWYNRDGKAFR
ncbi:unnamed protein product [Closterium sp. NIES-64]|nr:unnamed protein product [Closterium sp. NIES-65]CAI5995217.1 unnamed protein product [Closterium sp. NIES-64]CAI6009831.1 unnamed protein product [Closterium sp. NIES-65]